MNRMLAFWLAILFCMGGLTIIWIGWRMADEKRVGSETLVDDQPVMAADARNPKGRDDDIISRYTLTDRFGRAFASEQLAGKVHVTSFFFSNCPSVCLIQNKKIKTLEEEFGPRGVVFVSITCDPQNDTPKRLREYADLLGADPRYWKFLTGELLYIRRIGAEMYMVPVDDKSHTEKLTVSGREGKVRGHFSWQDVDEFAELRKTLKALLVEQEPAGDVAVSRDTSTVESANASEKPVATDDVRANGRGG